MRLDHVNIVVSDLEVSRRFYGGTLGLTRGFEATLEGDWIEAVTGLHGVHARCVFYEFPSGGPRLELLQYVSPTGEALPANGAPNTLGVRHLAFVVDDMDAFVRRLKAAQVPLLSEPMDVPFAVGSAGRKRIVYFRDPDGVLLEAAAYTPDL